MRKNSVVLQNLTEPSKKKGNDVWYTNLEVSYRHDRMILTEEYSPTKYPQYDNYDAIEVGKQKDIPLDYPGVMGVPISFLQNYNPEQFEIIWQASGNTRASAPKEILEQLCYQKHPEDRGGCGVVNNKRMYSRIFIKKRGEISNAN